MKLYNYANVIRSKNAGPFTLTIDLMFDRLGKFKNALRFLSARKETIAGLYGVRKELVQIHRQENTKTVKITLPRPVSAGGLNDIDVYGSQQHFPIAEMDIPAYRASTSARRTDFSG